MPSVSLPDYDFLAAISPIRPGTVHRKRSARTRQSPASDIAPPFSRAQAARSALDRNRRRPINSDKLRLPGGLAWSGRAGLSRGRLGHDQPAGLRHVGRRHGARQPAGRPRRPGPHPRRLSRPRRRPARSASAHDAIIAVRDGRIEPGLARGALRDRAGQPGAPGGCDAGGRTRRADRSRRRPQGRQAAGRDAGRGDPGPRRDPAPVRRRRPPCSASPARTTSGSRQSDGAITDFTTVMTGEMFALLRAHGVLAGMLDGAVTDGAAFRRGSAAGSRRRTSPRRCSRSGPACSSNGWRRPTPPPTPAAS